MEYYQKKFDELTVAELYRILKLRVEVFVVEQNCPYAELDGLDQEAIHVWLEDDEGIQAYLRVMDRGVESDYVSIGRVIAVRRRSGMGNLILRKGVEVAQQVFSADKIYLEAQTYAVSFYEKQGFHQISEAFTIDGIPHVKMLWEE